jgi:hypothetical protein
MHSSQSFYGIISFTSKIVIRLNKFNITGKIITEYEQSSDRFYLTLCHIVVDLMHTNTITKVARFILCETESKFDLMI